LVVECKIKDRSCFIRQFLERIGEGKYMVGRKMWKNGRRGDDKKDYVCIEQ
jgi:hypothetical protein